MDEITVFDVAEEEDTFLYGNGDLVVSQVYAAVLSATSVLVFPADISISVGIDQANINLSRVMITPADLSIGVLVDVTSIRKLISIVPEDIYTSVGIEEPLVYLPVIVSPEGMNIGTFMDATMLEVTYGISPEDMYVALSMEDGEVIVFATGRTWGPAVQSG